jgi:hypothetical protein
MAPSAARKFSSEVDDDPTFYPSEEKLGEDWVQSHVGDAFRQLLESYVEAVALWAVVGKDQFMYYVQGDPTSCVSPDVYLLPGVSPPDDGERLGSWKKWQIGTAPSFVLEIMSEHNKKKKDDRKSPLRHDALGTKELVVLDPYADERFKLRGRTRFRIFRRDSSGRLVLVQSTNERQIQSETLRCYLRVVGEGNSQRLRIATGPNGETIFPTRIEAEAQRADDEARRADDEAQRANEEAQRANEEEQRANEEARRTREAQQRADDEARRADDEAQRANEAQQRANDEARRADNEAKRANDEAKRASETDAENQRLRAELAALKRGS